APCVPCCGRALQHRLRHPSGNRRCDRRSCGVQEGDVRVGVGCGMTNTPRRLGVLGTFVWDTIWHPGGGGKPVEQWGGIAYSLAAMAAACPAGWRVEPIARIGADLEDEVFRF